MLEAEARWHVRDSQRGSRGKAEPPAHSFVTLSRRQAEALQQHHELTTSATAAGRAAGKLRRSRHHSHHALQPSGPRSYAVTSLSSLDSQYVGPIGVGTVVQPAGCKQDGGRSSLLYLPKASANASLAAGGGAAGSKSQRQRCHVEDQTQVWVVFDTGSTNIWVSSDLCQKGACSKPGRRRYDHTQSESFQSPPSDAVLNIEFGTGKISGPQAIEDFHVGPFTVYNQTFGMIQVQDGRVFDEVPFEGILGLAFPSMSANGVTPFFDNIVHQKTLNQSEFAFYFSLDSTAANAVFWGGVDPAFYNGRIEYFPVVDPYYWSLDLQSFKIGNDTLLGGGGGAAAAGSFLQRSGAGAAAGGAGPKAIVDTGTTFFTAESELYEEVMRRLPAAQCDAVTDATHPPIEYVLRNVDGEARGFRLRNSQYMTWSGPGGDSVCSPAFMRINIPEKHGPAMVLGEVFLRHHFSVFDRGDGLDGNARVGFAPAAQGDQVLRRLKDLTVDQPAFSESRDR